MFCPGGVRAPVNMWAERLQVDASKLVDNVAMAGLAARLVQSPVLFRPSVGGKTLPRSSPKGRSVHEEMTKLRQRYASSDPDVKETDAHHPLCHSVVWLAWQHLFDETLGGNATVPVSLSPVTPDGPRTSFRSALSHEGLAGVDGVGHPELYLNGAEMLVHDAGPRPWRCGRRGEPKSSTKIADAALMSWLPRGSSVPPCAWDGALLTIDFEPRLFEQSKYTDDLVTSAEIWGEYIRATAFRALRRAAYRVSRADLWRRPPVHFLVITDGVYWLFVGVGLGNDGRLHNAYSNVRRCDDPVGVLADLRNIMVLALLRPTFRVPKSIMFEAQIVGHMVKIEQQLGEWDGATVVLCSVRKKGPDGEHVEWVVMRVSIHQWTAETTALNRLGELSKEIGVPEGQSWLSALPWSLPGGESCELLPDRNCGFTFPAASTPLGIPLDNVCTCHPEVRKAVVGRLETFKEALRSAQTGTPPFTYSFGDLTDEDLALRLSVEDLRKMSTYSSLDPVLEELRKMDVFVLRVGGLAETTGGASTDLSKLDETIESFGG